jgi:hypothetical protein
VAWVRNAWVWRGAGERVWRGAGERHTTPPTWVPSSGLKDTCVAGDVNVVEHTRRPLAQFHTCRLEVGSPRWHAMYFESPEKHTEVTEVPVADGACTV